MLLRRIRIRNLRCLKDVTIPCDPLTVLVGANGAGKSSVLRALELFYAPVARYTEEDFHGGITTEPIEVAVTFGDLAEEELRLFGPYLEEDFLTVEKVMGWPADKSNQRYYGSRRACPDFARVRTASRATERRSAYQALVDSGRYPDLEVISSRATEEQILGALGAWETQHPQALEKLRDEGQFFGFREVGEAHLERNTQFLSIPAVRDAVTDGHEGRGSAITELMDLLVRSALEEREELQHFREEATRRYVELTDPATVESLRYLAGNMTRTIATFAPGTEVRLEWARGVPVVFPPLEATIKVVEDGYPTAVERSGHGVQRAFILTALQHLAMARAPGRASSQPSAMVEGTENRPLPNLILGIEEPELYQHPSRQRHLATVLKGLADGGIPGVAGRTQVIYSTHSPLLVDLQRFDQIRLLRKEEPFPGVPKQTHVHLTTRAQVVRELERVNDVPVGQYDPDQLPQWLFTLMTPWINEGFFAEVVVLVEGEEDRAAILGMAQYLALPLDAMNISVIPCGGKANLPKAAVVFRSLGIPTYVVWDSDEGKGDRSPQENHRLMRLHGKTIEDRPAGITDQYACFRVDLGHTLRDEIGENLHRDALRDAMVEFRIEDRDQAMKRPFIVKAIIDKANTKGRTSESLRKIVLRIRALHKGLGSEPALPARTPDTSGVTPR